MALRSPSFTFEFTYDVFLSFRGSDTRHGFTGNLWKALHDKGIRTFIDDKELQRGDEITPALVKAIEESRIAIPVFSANYTSSSFCLDELVTIIERIKAKGRLVLPIFYDVDPSHVRYQTQSYGEALAKHEAKFTNSKEKFVDNMERLQKWKMALHQAANLSGMHFKLGNEYEHEFIGKIVNEVSSKINRIPLHVADYPIGLESRMLKVMSLLDVGSGDGVHMVGIYGIGGIGKTTLARAVYNSIADSFEGLCFLHDVRENSIKHGLIHLQETLLSEIVGEKDMKIGSVHKGISIIMHRLHRKKVLLILDDVDNLEQLHATVGGPNWFGNGSRVIVTTRDTHLLTRHGIEKRYKVVELNEEEALELLCWNAFRNDMVDPSYEFILNQTLAYASGLPLALEVIGSLLLGKSIQEWGSAIDGFKQIPCKRIQDKLEVSYNALEEQQKKIFLDIACCLKGYELTEVEEILCAHYGVPVKYGIGVLVDKSLIKITWRGKVIVTMHDLIEDMGKEIVRQRSPEELGKRSRLWFHEDIVEVLEENLGTSKIEMIHLDSLFYGEIRWNGKAFKKMKNLRTLIIKKDGHFSKGPECLPNSLRVLEWNKYPSPNLPPDFHPKKLSICKLPKSRLTSFGMHGSLKTSKFMNISVLNLDSCGGLTRIPDVSGLTNLERLSFKECENLITIHHSVGLLNKLKILDAFDCSMIKKFPPLQLMSLEKLELSYCSSLESFPEILVRMENITDLHLEGTCIAEFPSSFGNLSRLQRLVLRDYDKTIQLPTSIMVMMPELAEICVTGVNGLILANEEEGEEKVSSMLPSNVKRIEFICCNFSDGFLDFSLTWCANVKEVSLCGSDFTIVPECIKECHFLRKLNVDYCKRLREIRGIPPSLEYLSAEGCESLSFPCRSMLLNEELHEAGNTNFLFPSPTTGIPEWFEHQCRGPSISFWFRNNFPHIALCLLYPPIWELLGDIIVFINGKGFYYVDGEKYYWRDKIYVDEIDYTDDDKNECTDDENDCIDEDENDKFQPLPKFPGHTFLFHILVKNLVGMKGKFNLDEALSKTEWNHVKVIIEAYNEPIRIGIHVLKERSNNIRFTNPYKKRKLDLNLPPLPEDDVNTKLTL